MSVPFVSYHVFMKYYAAEPKKSSILHQKCFEHLWEIVPKLRPCSNYTVPKFSKKNTGC
jgi:hypothetical protein